MVRVPVHWRTNPGGPLLAREVYSASVVVARAERTTVEELKETVVAASTEFIRDGALPVYLLRVGERDVLIYRQPPSGFLAELVTGAPVSEPNLPSLRIKITGYPLRSAGEVAVFRVSPSSLGLEPPTAVFADASGVVWIPVFNVEGRTLIAEAMDGPFEQEVRGDVASTLLRLYDEVAAALAECGVLAEAGALLCTAVSEVTQQALVDALSPADFSLAYTREQRGASVHETIPVMHWQGSVLALVSAPEAGGLLVRGDDRWALQDRVGQALEALGVLPLRDRLVVETA